MRIVLLLLLCVLAWPSEIRGQHTIINRQGAVFYTPAEMKQIGNRMLNLIDQTVTSEENTDSLYMYHIIDTELWTGMYGKLSKEDFREKNFEKNVLRHLRTSKSGLSAYVQTMFLNKNKEFIGGGTCKVYEPYCTAKYYDRSVPIALKMDKHKFKTAFYIYTLSCIPPIVYFALDENNRPYVIHSKGRSEGESSYTVSRLNDFVDLYWDEYFPKGVAN